MWFIALTQSDQGTQFLKNAQIPFDIVAGLFKTQTGTARRVFR